MARITSLLETSTVLFGSSLIMLLITKSFFGYQASAKTIGLPISLVFRQTPSLRRLLTESRPYEDRFESTDYLTCGEDN